MIVGWQLATDTGADLVLGDLDMANGRLENLRIIASVGSKGRRV